MTQGIAVQARVVGALILREARVRHGRTKFGYFWSIVEPVFYVAALAALFTAAGGRPPFGENMALFFASGVLPFHLFRNIAQQLGASFDANKPLFSYPIIHQIDAVIARFVLEVATWLVVLLLVMGILILILDAPNPHDISKSLLAVGLLALMGYGIGLINAVIRRKYKAWGIMYNVVTSPLLFISGVFYTLDSIPSHFRAYLAWNPLIHGIEGVRDGYYLNYRSSELDLQYLMWWGVISLTLGLFFERNTRYVEL